MTTTRSATLRQLIDAGAGELRGSDAGTTGNPRREATLLLQAAVGLDRAEFDRLRSDPQTRARVSASKQEGLKNKVEATPTMYINGKRYRADLNTEALRDALEEEHDRVTGVLCKP